MRNAFIKTLTSMAANDPRILLVVGDLGYSVVEDFVKLNPKQFINAGIAEQNMMGMAAGLASEGYRPFVYSIANFPTFRCAEQIRNDVDYHENPVVTVAVGGGLAYGNLGYSHHAIQDFALMRSFPNTIIAAPGDPIEVSSSIEYLLGQSKPAYLRLGKAGEPTYHARKPELGLGYWHLLSGDPSSRGAILSTGANLERAMAMAGSGKYAGYAVYSMPIWGRAGSDVQAEMVARFTHLVVVEDHLAEGGLGSWILECANTAGINDVKIERAGLSDAVLGRVGTQQYLTSLATGGAIA